VCDVTLVITHEEKKTKMPEKAQQQKENPQAPAAQAFAFAFFEFVFRIFFCSLSNSQLYHPFFTSVSIKIFDK
jgi:hypothetical protein